jgi:carboxymethylenebutenolidase
MSVTTRTERIAMGDGATMGAYVAVPESGSGPGVLVLMEIFGVGVYIREAAERLAGEGYVALAPDLYRRIRPGAEYPHDEGGLRQAGAAVGELDIEGAIADAIVAMDHLRALPEVTGPVGTLGFCLGGTLAFGVAIGSDPACTVSYYGSGVPDMLTDGAGITGPVLFHFGGADTYIPRAQAEQVKAASDGHPGWECHIYDDGGHAFDNWDSEMFHRPEPAARAWTITREFLHRSLPVAATAA